MSETSSASNNGQGKEFIAFSEGSFSWQFIEKPTFDSFIGEIYGQRPRVLDAGCGAGRLTSHLVNSGVLAENITGIDIDQEMADTFATHQPNANVVQGSVSRMPFRAESFDAIVSNMLLHQMDNNDLRKFLNEASRVLTKGGTLFFVDSNPYSTQERSSNVGSWITQKTPWGTEIQAYIHDLRGVLSEESVGPMGFELEAIGEPKIDESGEQADPAEYTRYSRCNLRFMAKLVKS